MIKEALQLIMGTAVAAAAVDPEVEVDGRYYWRDNKLSVLEPTAYTLAIHSLRGLADYVEHYSKVVEGDLREIESELANGLLIHIEGPRKVSLISNTFGDHRQRDTYATASPPDGDGFAFGRWMDTESFIIAMGAQFEDADDRAKVISFASNIRAEKMVNQVDDGLSQSVTAKQGIAKIGTVEIDNPYKLRPYRTFADIDQPAGEFVLRFRGSADEPISVALFEIDDGHWRRECISRIRDYFAKRLEGVPVIG